MSITFDHIPIEEYANNLYRSEVCVTPINGLAAFDQAMIEQYHELGFVSVANAINQQEIDSVLGAMLDIVLDENAKGVQLQFENEARGKVEEVGRDRYLDYVRKFMWFSHLHPATQTLMYHPELVKILENLLGGEVEMFQDIIKFSQQNKKHTQAN